LATTHTEQEQEPMSASSSPLKKIAAGVAMALLAGNGLPGLTRAQTQGGGQPQGDVPFKIVRLDPALDSIVSPDAKLEMLGDRFGLAEGPVWIPDGQSGYLLFSDIAANLIYRWSPGAPLSVFMEKAGYTGRDTLNVGQQTVTGGRIAILLIGANALTVDPQGRLIICAMTDRNLVRIEKDGMRTVLADRYQGKRFSGPNDIIVKSDGAIYFTDSVGGLRGGDDSPQREVPYNGFYLVKDGQVTLLGSDEGHPSDFPNGIGLSPDERFLYVTAGFGKTFRYDVQPNDTVSNGKLFVETGNDGLKVDRRGNLYSSNNSRGVAEISITSPEGKRLGAIQMPRVSAEPRPRICATNVAFGDADAKGLYITGCSALFHIRLNTPGILPARRS
jgi:gluconolactonase